MKKIITIFLGFAPIFAFAQFATQLSTGTGTLGGILAIIFQILNFLIPILIALGMVFFVYSVINYITAKDEEKKGAAKNMMIYSIIGLFVIASVWGLVSVLNTTFGISQGGGIGQQMPCIYDNPNIPGPC